MIDEQQTTLGRSFNIFTNGDSMRRILMVNNGSLLEEGVTKLLGARKDLDVLSRGFKNEEALLRCLDSTHSEVVVISRESSINLPHLFGLLGQIHQLNRLQILVISADSNMIDVYENQQVCELHGQDFFDFLQNATFK